MSSPTPLISKHFKVKVSEELREHSFSATTTGVTSVPQSKSAGLTRDDLIMDNPSTELVEGAKVEPEGIEADSLPSQKRISLERKSGRDGSEPWLSTEARSAVIAIPFCRRAFDAPRAPESI